MRQVGLQSFFVLAAMAAASVSLMACPASLDDECAEQACDPTARDGSATDGDDDDGGPVDPCSAHPDDAACMDDSQALFVSGAGSDDAPGTRAAPLKTIGAALGKVTDSKHRVYVCSGAAYTDNVEIKTAVSLFGGFSCSWAPSTTKAKIAPAKGVALRVTKVDAAVLVQDFEIVGSADSAVPGDSAIAAFVSESTNVKFNNALLTAGDGVAGEKGASRSNYNGATASGGSPASAGGAGAVCACTDMTTSTGGNGAAPSGTGIKNGSSSPAVGGANSGLSGDTTCQDGTAGADGLPNGAGSSASSAGTLTALAWDPTTQAENAPSGNPGQGGGGGGAKTQGAGSGGGGGACGGCGGAGGERGANGGSSFALLSFESGVIVQGGTLQTKAGGRGGDGGDGQRGQAGGGVSIGACNGGAGGNGAGGSGGGGGAGGHSVLVGYVGSAPTVKGAAMTHATKGAAGGDGGLRGESDGKPGVAGTPGVQGKAEDASELASH